MKACQKLVEEGQEIYLAHPIFFESMQNLDLTEQKSTLCIVP